MAKKIAEEPAFSWWVKNTLRNRERILAKFKSRYFSRTHKFGVHLPKRVQEVYRIDRDTGTDFWTKAIEREIKKVMVAFKFSDDNKVPIGCTKID
jgi:hypothetical protein